MFKIKKTKVKSYKAAGKMQNSNLHFSELVHIKATLETRVHCIETT